MNDPRGKRPPAAWTFLILAACAVCYANGLTGDYTYDDKAIVRDNVRIRSPRSVEQIFTTPYFGGLRGQGTGYRPVLLLSYAAQWWVHGDSRIGFHAANLALHALAALLLLRLLLRLGVPPPVALGSALLFAVHPIHVEAVASLVGRGETLAAVFVLAGLLIALRFYRGPRRAAALAGATVCYALGVLTKESAAIVPALALLAFWRLEEGSPGRRLRVALARGWPLFAAAVPVLAGVFALRRFVLGGYLKSQAFPIFEVENPLAPLADGPRVAGAAAILLRYLGRLFLPLRLSADESAWSIPVGRGPTPLHAAALLLLAGLLAAAIAKERARRDVAFGVLFLAAAFAPAANVLFPTGTIFAERLAYLPSAGFCLALASLLLPAAGAPDSIRRRSAGVFWIVALAFAARTVVRNPVWRDDETLFAESVRSSPESAKTHYNFAWVSAEAGNLPRALDHYTRATRIYPRYFDAWAGKGLMEQKLGMLAEAEASFLESLRIAPAYENGFFRLGVVRELRGDLLGAERAYSDGLAKKPESPPLAFRWAGLRARLDRPSAEADWRRAVSIARGASAFRLGLARWLLGRGRPEDARQEARKVLRRNPRDLAALSLLADANARDGRRFAEGLAVEKILRLTRARGDLDRLRRVAAEDPGYRARLDSVSERLRRLAPQAFTGAPRGARPPVSSSSAGVPARAGAPPSLPRGGAGGDTRATPPGPGRTP